jgi:hypothetical protein
MEMRFSRDHSADGAEFRCDRAVRRGEAKMIAIKPGATGGSKASQVEAVLERDGNPPQGLSIDVFTAKPARLVA